MTTVAAAQDTPSPLAPSASDSSMSSTAALLKPPNLAGDRYTIADIAVWPWYGQLVRDNVYSAAEFLSAHEYTHVQRWAEEIAKRPAVIRGQRVNRTWGDEETQVPERHQPNDLS